MRAEKSVNSISRRSKILIIIGFLFFVNPIPTVLDILPDAIGCLLLFFGLKQLAFFNESVERARRLLLYLLAASSVKLILTRSVMLSEFLSDKLLAATAFSVVEAIIYVLFFRAFFDGVSYLAARNNCELATQKSGGTAFLSYLAFFIRIIATVIPELPALFETQLYTEIDPDKLDLITDLISLKPLLMLMLSLIALGFGIAWFVSMYGFVSAFLNTAGESLDERYTEEYTSRPEKVLPDKIRLGSFVIYFSLIFTFDFAIDNKKILPFAAMFLVLFVASFMFKGVAEFRSTRKLSAVAFVLLLIAELFRAEFIIPGAVVIYEPKLWVAAVSALIGVISAAASLLCVKALYRDLELMANGLNVKMPSANTSWICFCIFAVLWTTGYINSYLYSFASTPRLIAAAAFVWFTVKLIGDIKDSAKERALYYPAESTRTKATASKEK
ncbi:MAG: hypothetical protein IJB49_03775 [Clostridia bacterium]|nr:hypothetical protein [Clostridia bacterium]